MSKILQALSSGGLSLLLGFTLIAQAAAQTLNPGDILVADADALGGAGAVIRIDPVTGAQMMISSGGNFVDPFGLALEASGQIVVADQGAAGVEAAVIRVDPVTGDQIIVSSGGHLTSPVGITIDSDGIIIVADMSGTVIRVDPITKAQTVVPPLVGSLLVHPTGVALDADNRKILVTDFDPTIGGTIYRIDPLTGTQTPISSGLSAFPMVILDAKDDILVPENPNLPNLGSLRTPRRIGCVRNFAVVRVDPVSGERTNVSAGGLLISPIGIALVPETVLFATFNAKLEIELHPLANDDEFQVKATFTLGNAGAEIDPLTENVSLRIGDFSTTIAAGPFKKDKKGRFKFERIIDDVALDAVIRPLGGGSFVFKAEGGGADLTGTVNPVAVGLTIGNDAGSTQVTAEFK